MKKNKLNFTVLILSSILFGLIVNTHVIAKEKSILDRVRKIENPELVELIRITIDKLPETKRSRDNSDPQLEAELDYQAVIAKTKAIRIVTEKYAQISLLDEKIQNLNKKIQDLKFPTEVNLELVIAKVTLETQRMKTIAELREAMNVIPRYPWGEIGNDDMSTWIHLEVFENNVRAFRCIKPFYKYSLGSLKGYIHLKSSEDVFDYIEKILESNKVFPIRFSFSSTIKGQKLTEAIKRKIMTISEANDIKYETDLTIYNILRNNVRNINLYKNGIHINSVPSPKPYTMDQYISILKNELKKVDTVPLTIHIRHYDNTCEDIVKQLEASIEDLDLDYAIQIRIEQNQ